VYAVSEPAASDPIRHRCCIRLLKSPAADGLINALSDSLPFPVGRVVDWTDLIGLTVLVPVAWLTRDPATRFARKKKWELALILLALFSLVATAETPTTPTTVATYHVEYSFNVSTDSLFQLMRGFQGPTRWEGPSSFNIPWVCPDGLTAHTRVLGTNTESRMRLERITSYCSREGWSVHRNEPAV
jgi:hypothetical protein